MSYFNTYPNRTMCEVLKDMRKMHDTRNYAALLALIEEAQYMANKMEEGLLDKNDIKAGKEKLKELKRDIKELKKKKKKLVGKKDDGEI